MDGTNALRLAPSAFTTFRFDFGPQSYARHRTQAQASGLMMCSVCDPLLMFDIDGPSQYQRWERDAPAWLLG
jgi:2-phospho-L-lactate guanylyltransferase (CobY/MobA/RfbA family)